MMVKHCMIPRTKISSRYLKISILKNKVCHSLLHDIYLNPLPDDKILDWSKLKQFADDNFKFDENSRKFSRQVENTVGKGEIARHEQFLLFPQCFQKACFPGASKGVIVWEWLKSECVCVWGGGFLHKNHKTRTSTTWFCQYCSLEAIHAAEFNYLQNKRKKN